MKIKNLTKLLAGAKVTSRRPPQPEMVIVVRGAYVLAPHQPLALPEGLYPLSQGNLTADVLHEGDEERTGEVLYPSDFADFKLNAEVMVKGACHPPGQRPARTCLARVSVGTWSKELRVVGRRVFWVDSVLGEVITEPVPFTRMPLSYTHAFGGPGDARNPIGKGASGDELPNIEAPSAPITSRSDRPSPAGFGPRNPLWADRAGKVGQAYGAEYRRTRAPYFAEDFDWRYFHAAPADQQISGYLRGDEEIAFVHMHPEVTVFSKTLPGVRVRAFVSDREGRFREVVMRLDTLFADLDKERLYLTWRGLVEVREGDLSDVRTLLVADEKLADPPSPADDYKERLEAFERDPLGLDEAIPESKRAAFEALRRDAESGSGAPSPDPVSALLKTHLGAAMPDEQARVTAAVAQALGAKGAPRDRIATKLAEAVARLPKPQAAASVAPGAPPRVALAATLSALAARAEAMASESAAKGTNVPGLDKLRELLADPRLKALDPAIGSDRTPPEPGPGADLSGLDLSERDLRGADLRGANLEGAILTSAKLAGASLTNAKLARAVLFEADLEGADLSGADLTLTNMTRANAPSIDLRGATLEGTNATEARLTSASMRGAKGKNAIFLRADLSGADAVEVSIERAIFEGAKLVGAVFTGADLTRCRFAEANATSIDLSSSILTGATFADADLSDANIKGARGEGSVWLRATLHRADMTGALLNAAHLSEAKATSVKLRGANLDDARLYRAVLELADLRGANLFSANLCNAVLTGAKLGGASLYDAKLTGADLRGAELRGANLKRSTLETT